MQFGNRVFTLRIIGCSEVISDLNRAKVGGQWFDGAKSARAVYFLLEEVILEVLSIIEG
jgi:hypothetical protein